MGFDGFQNPPVGAQGIIARPVFKSENWVSGVSGWAIFKDGEAEFNSLGGSFQITSSGIFFYVPSAGIGNLRMSLTNADGTDPYGNIYKRGLFINQRQIYAVGSHSDTVAINPSGGLFPELLFTPAGFSPLAHIICDGPNNRLVLEAVGGSGAKVQANAPFEASQNLYLTNSSGLLNISFSSMNSYLQDVAFPTPFNTRPVVYTNIESGAGETLKWGSKAINPTTTGFTLELFANDGVVKSWTNRSVSWTAFGT